MYATRTDTTHIQNNHTFPNIYRVDAYAAHISKTYKKTEHYTLRRLVVIQRIHVYTYMYILLLCTHLSRKYPVYSNTENSPKKNTLICYYLFTLRNNYTMLCTLLFVAWCTRGYARYAYVEYVVYYYPAYDTLVYLVCLVCIIGFITTQNHTRHTGTRCMC